MLQTAWPYLFAALSGLLVWRYISAWIRRKRELEREHLFKQADDIAAKARTGLLSELVRKANERFRRKRP